MSLSMQPLGFGAFTPIRTGGDLMEAINLLEARVGRRCDIVNSFRKWSSPSGDITLASTRQALAQASAAGRRPMVTWEPLTFDGRQGPYTLEAIAAGEFDDYLRTWAAALRDWGTEVYLRPMHEMNGNWYWWSGDPQAYVAAWQHIVRLFDSEGAAATAQWVWCVNAADQPADNTLKAYWPGEDFVDVVGIDGYNCYGGWRDFAKIIRPAYDRVCALSEELPIWVCETASAEADLSIAGATSASSKAQWIADAFAAENLRRVEMLMYFDADNPSTYAWRLGSSPAAEHEMRRQLARSAGHVPAPGPYLPPAPTGVYGAPLDDHSVRLSWRPVKAFTRGYRVLHRELGEQTWKLLTTTTATSADITDLPPGLHEFAVCTYTLVKQSNRSLIVTISL